ncbi:MAG: M24 family metallopeptidase [Gemmatimonadota bacterium]|nr:M24 family metallopeptidase [Gemmatimonadota bacterium]
MGANLSPEFVETALEGLTEHEIDAWLLYDFRAKNSLAADLLGMPEGQKRRYFVLLRPGSAPLAVVQKIEVSGWAGWPYELVSYLSWKELEDTLRSRLDGCATVAMEVSPGDGIPYIDHVPAGVVELVESVGPRVVSSVDLISATAAQWSPRGHELHHQAAELIARTARSAFELAVRAAGLEAAPVVETVEGFDIAGEPTPVDEHDLAEWVRGHLEAGGLTGADTIIAVGPNAAKPHYTPEAGSSLAFEPGQVFMVDLWGKTADEPDAVYADQTWMGVLAPTPDADVLAGWEAIRDARDAAIETIRQTPDVTGADADRAARAVLIERGFEEAIFHRTGHGIDRDIHGVGPTLDSIEMRDDRRLVTGVGFSVEPGVYLEGRFGLRTEVDVYMREDGPEVTPSGVQTDLWHTAGPG